ncbi:MAG: hypothetical protein AABZ14_00840, partial [Candidatus Margulisiibacteriota bacterium]
MSTMEYEEFIQQFFSSPVQTQTVDAPATRKEVIQNPDISIITSRSSAESDVQYLQEQKEKAFGEYTERVTKL